MRLGLESESRGVPMAGDAPESDANERQELQGEVVRQLGQEDVVRILLEQLAERLAEREAAVCRVVVDPAVVPDQEQGRSRAVLPAEDRVSAQRLEVEVVASVGDGHRLEVVRARA